MKLGTTSALASPASRGRVRRWLLRGLLLLLIVLLPMLIWFFASLHEWLEYERKLPGEPYADCGTSQPAALPERVQVGFYEEFPNPWRLEKLVQLDFPASLAVAAGSRDEYLQLRDSIARDYPMVTQIYFWPVLAREEGYYTGAWSDPAAVERAASAAQGLPALWDLEMPNAGRELPLDRLDRWWRNRAFIDGWLAARDEPVHIWRTDTHMGLDPAFLRLIGMHYDPLDYPAVWLHLDLYSPGFGALPEEQLRRIMRCGVERYGPRFVPSLGVLDDGEADASRFIASAQLRRNLRIAREAGVSELWLFGANGLNQEHLAILHETLPLGEE